VYVNISFIAGCSGPAHLVGLSSDRPCLHSEINIQFQYSNWSFHKKSESMTSTVL